MDGGRLERALVREFPGEWELEYFADFAPRKTRLTADNIEVYDRSGAMLASVTRHKLMVDDRRSW
jgi:hypothetical protein